MRKSVFLLLLVAVTGLSALAPATPVPKEFQVELLTATPGQDIYSAWGHTLLRIYDPRLGQTLVFDYGNFQLDPFFFWRFIRGEPTYFVAASTWLSAKARFEQEGRFIFSQQIFLENDQARQLADFLYRQIQPENRLFVYHHLQANCTTLVRDLLDQAMGQRLRQIYADKKLGQTYRLRAVDEKNIGMGFRFLLNLVSGSELDHEISYWQDMFQPLSLMSYLDQSRSLLLQKNGQPLVGQLQSVGWPYSDQSRLWQPEQTPQTSVLALPLLLVLLYFSAVFFLVKDQRRQRRFFMVLISIWSLVASVAGLLIVILQLAAVQGMLHHNNAILAFNPLLLALPFLLGQSQNRGRLQKIALFYLAFPLAGMILALAKVWPGHLDFLGFALLLQAAVYVMVRFSPAWKTVQS